MNFFGPEMPDASLRAANFNFSVKMSSRGSGRLRAVDAPTTSKHSKVSCIKLYIQSNSSIN